MDSRPQSEILKNIVEIMDLKQYNPEQCQTFQDVVFSEKS